MNNNALSGPPPQPDLPQTGGQTNSLMPMPAPSVMPQTSALQPPSPQQNMPAPNHQQTVAALRHFDVLEKGIAKLLADPDLGKTDMKSKIQDEMVGLVAKGMVAPAEAVTELSTLPERPFDQKTWLEKHYVQTIMGAAMVLDHHKAAFAGTPPMTSNENDDHLTVMAGLADHYRGLTNGGR